MTEDRVIADGATSTVTPVRAEMGGINAVYRYQSEPVAGLTGTPEATRPAVPLAKPGENTPG